MKWRTRLLRVAAFLGLLASPLTADADQVLVGNLDQPVSALSPSFIDATDFWAQQFTTGVSANLTNIMADLGMLDTGANGDLALTAQLVSVPALGDTPDQGTVIDTLTLKGGLSSIPTDSFANVEFDPTKTDSLSSSGFYYLVLSVTSSDGGSVAWNFTDSTTVHGTGTLPNYAAGSPGPPWQQFEGSPFLIQVSGTPSVPEPSSWVLGSIGLSLALLVRRKMRGRRCA